MSAAETNNAVQDKETGPTTVSPQMSAEEREVAVQAARFGYGPLAQVNTTDNRLRPFGGEFQPGLYKSVEQRKFANPAPLGLSAFALTTFVLSAINMGAHNVNIPSIVIGLAFGYGGLVQLLAGMWEMAIGNTFGATALSSYGGFWISFAIILTPGFKIASSLGSELNAALALYLLAWFIFTTILVFLTLRSTVAFFLLFLFLDVTFLLLGIAYLFPYNSTPGAPAAQQVWLPNHSLQMAGGLFGLLSAFAAWYNAFAGIADSSNSFFIVPVVHFPWSPTARARKEKSDREVV